MTSTLKLTGFQKHRRLLIAKQFQRVFDDVDCKQSGNYFTFLTRTNSELVNRLGLVISKKNAPLSVTRNKIKRVVREQFRTSSQTNANTNSYFDIIVLAKPATKSLSNQELHQEFQSQWQRLIKKRQKLETSQLVG